MQTDTDYRRKEKSIRGKIPLKRLATVSCWINNALHSPQKWSIHSHWCIVPNPPPKPCCSQVFLWKKKTFYKDPGKVFGCAVTSDQKGEKLIKTFIINNTTKRKQKRLSSCLISSSVFWRSWRSVSCDWQQSQSLHLWSHCPPLGGSFWGDLGYAVSSLPASQSSGGRVSGSVEFGLKEREDSDMDITAWEPRISLILADFSMLYTFFINMGLSETPSGDVAPILNSVASVVCMGLGSLFKAWIGAMQEWSGLHRETFGTVG